MVERANVTQTARTAKRAMSDIDMSRWTPTVIERWQNWRNEDHADSAVISRSDVITLLEEVERLRAEEASLRKHILHLEDPCEVKARDEMIAKLRVELADWQQAARVEASLRREFHDKFHAERERCAKIAEGFAVGDNLMLRAGLRAVHDGACYEIAAAIRRGD